MVDWNCIVSPVVFALFSCLPWNVKAAMNLTVREAAQLLSVSEKSIYRWIRDRHMPHYRIQDQYRFNRAELLEWATAERISVSPDIFKEPDDGAHAMPSLAQALEAGGIFYRIGGRTRDEALRCIVSHMRIPEEVDREFLYKVLLAREELGSTGIGDGIAIPHVRNPVVMHVTTPAITLCFLDEAIDFHAIDGKPVNILFTLISPTIRLHLHMISRLAFALRDETFRTALTAQESREALLAHVKRIDAQGITSGGPAPV